jgi:hypothetical protein
MVFVDQTLRLKTAAGSILALIVGLLTAMAQSFCCAAADSLVEQARINAEWVRRIEREPACAVMMTQHPSTPPSQLTSRH